LRVVPVWKDRATLGKRSKRFIDRNAVVSKGERMTQPVPG
jgi:hypothetical protein